MLQGKRMVLSVLALFALVSVAGAADLREGLKQGNANPKSIGALAFGPEGILFFGDAKGAAVFAIDTDDRTEGKTNTSLEVANFNGQVASMLGVEAGQITVSDLAVNPISKQAYVSVQRGRGPDATSVLLRVDTKGKISEVNLKSVKFAKADLVDKPTRVSSRSPVITDVEFYEGKIFVAGISNEEFSSSLRVIPFPFNKVTKGAGVKIFHGAHGRFETSSPIRTLVPYEIAGNAHILAAYTCTPLVKIPLAELKPGARVTGTTVAELGNRNRPLDIVPYTKGKESFLLIANSSRGTMKVSAKNIGEIKGITKRVSGTDGLKYETLKELDSVVQLAKVDDGNVVLLTSSPKPDRRGQVPGGKTPKMDLKVVALP